MIARASQRIQDLAASETMAVTAKAAELREQGIDVVGFGAGQPDFDTPQHIKDAAVAALAAGDTKYSSPVSGRNPLREAICDYLKQYRGVQYRRNQITVTAGAKDAIIQAFFAALDPGDEVLIPVPYWVSYPEQVKLAGGKPVFVHGPAGSASKIGPAELKAALTAKTRMLVLNSPSNPSGLMYSRAELEALADALRDTNVLVLSDELYHRLVLDGSECPSFAELDGMYDRTILINGLSKTYAMTGWRLGFASGPASIIGMMARMQGQTTSGAVSFVQAAAITALSGDQSCVDKMVAAYRERARIMCDGLNEIAGVTCEPSQGGFMCFPEVSATFDRLGANDSADFAQIVLEKAHVALVPGTAFGAPNHARLSFATSEAQIREGLARLKKLLSA